MNQVILPFLVAGTVIMLIYGLYQVIGGISEENVGEYLSLPNVPVVGGTWVANREAQKSVARASLVAEIKAMLKGLARENS